jgi:hypothetical protein
MLLFVYLQLSLLYLQYDLQYDLHYEVLIRLKPYF